MKNEGWPDITEGWGGNGCSEGFGGLRISTDTLIGDGGGACIEGDNGLGCSEGWMIDSGTQI